MESIDLNKQPQNAGITIMIFTEGTILKPKSWRSLYNHTSYVPIGNCIEIIKDWQVQGADIIYCTSRRGKTAADIVDLLMRFGFVGSKLCYRSQGEKYKDIVEKVRPDVLIEDDCKSIGGTWQMCITNVDSLLKEKMISVVVKEFKGIDELPKNIKEFA